jgi:hypothetical protein
VTWLAGRRRYWERRVRDAWDRLDSGGPCWASPDEYVREALVACELAFRAGDACFVSAVVDEWESRSDRDGGVAFLVRRFRG